MQYNCEKCKSIIILNAFTKTKCEICGNDIYSPHIPGYVICEDCLEDMARNGTIICRQCGELISENPVSKDISRGVRRKATIYANIRKNKLKNNLKNANKEKTVSRKVTLSKRDASLCEKCDFDGENYGVK